MFVDVLDDGAQLVSGQHSAGMNVGRLGGGETPQEVDGQDVAQRLGKETSPSAAGSHLGIQRQHGGLDSGVGQAVDGRKRHPVGVEVAGLGRDTGEPLRLEQDVD